LPEVTWKLLLTSLLCLVPLCMLSSRQGTTPCQNQFAPFSSNLIVLAVIHWRMYCCQLSDRLFFC
jgi:hypothetical protein